MAVLTTDVLITELARRLGHDTAAAAVRLDMLRRLNASLQDIVQDHSFLFLATSATVTVVSGTDTIAVPTTIDAGKALTLGRADGKGELTYVPPDDWFGHRIDTYESPTQTEPSAFTIARVAGVLTFLFKPGAVGGNKVIPYIGQAFVTALTDSSGSTPQLPEGFENTLLLIDAEAEERRMQSEPEWEELKARANDKKERLYSSWRTTKEKSMTDRERAETKIGREKLQPGK
jgi:hypothetical protein